MYSITLEYPDIDSRKLQQALIDLNINSLKISNDHVQYVVTTETLPGNIIDLGISIVAHGELLRHYECVIQYGRDVSSFLTSRWYGHDRTKIMGLEGYLVLGEQLVEEDFLIVTDYELHLLQERLDNVARVHHHLPNLA